MMPGREIINTVIPTPTFDCEGRRSVAILTIIDAASTPR
jgi:hypothetical protein